MYTKPLTRPERLWADAFEDESFRLIASMLLEVRASCDDGLAGVSDADLLRLMEELLNNFFRAEEQ